MQVATSTPMAPNGWLLEVKLDRDGYGKTARTVYRGVMAASSRRYHIHAVATYHVTCIKEGSGQLSTDRLRKKLSSDGGF